MAWLRNVSTETLGKIAGVGGVTLLGTATYLQTRLRQNLRATPMYQSAMNILRTHEGALYLLGEPIVEGKINIDYRENFCDGVKAYYKIPVSGPKDSAFYYFWAERQENEFIVTKGELELKKDPTKRLVILKQIKKEDNGALPEQLNIDNETIKSIAVK